MDSLRRGKITSPAAAFENPSTQGWRGNYNPGAHKWYLGNRTLAGKVSKEDGPSSTVASIKKQLEGVFETAKGIELQPKDIKLPWENDVDYIQQIQKSENFKYNGFKKSWVLFMMNLILNGTYK